MDDDKLTERKFCIFKPQPVLPLEQPLPKSVDYDEIVIALPSSTQVTSIINDALRKERIKGLRPQIALVGGEIYLSLVSPNPLVATAERYLDVKIYLDRSLGDLEVQIICEDEEEMYRYLVDRKNKR